MEKETEQERIANTFNKAKVLGAMQGIHNLTPPVQSGDDDRTRIAIIESLRVSPRLQEMFLEVQGLEYHPDEKKLYKIAKPIMNIDGAFRLVKICKRIAEEAEWSNFKDDEVDVRIMAYYAENYPHFTFWCAEFDLSPRDFNYVSSVLMSFIDSAFHKGKSAKYINAVSRMYNEDFLGKAIAGAPEKEKKKNFLDRIRDFNRR